MAAAALSGLFGACAVDTGPSPVQTRQPLAGGLVDADTQAVVSLRVRLGAAGTRQCTATLIAPNLVLTARHCLVAGLQLPSCEESFPELVEPSALDLVHATRIDSEEAAEVPVVHGASLLVPEEDAPCGADLALVVTDELFDITPIAPRLDHPAEAGERYVAVGYGMLGELSGGEGTRRRLDGLEVQCVGTACGSTATEREFLGAGGPCEGDSGGPSLVESGFGPELIGVLSRGTSACTHAVYVAVEPWATFLREGAELAAAAGDYEPPAWTFAPEGPEPPEPEEPTGGRAGAGGAPPTVVPEPADEPEVSTPSRSSPSGSCAFTKPGGLVRCGGEVHAMAFALAGWIARRRRFASQMLFPK